MTAPALFDLPPVCPECGGDHTTECPRIIAARIGAAKDRDLAAARRARDAGQARAQGKADPVWVAAFRAEVIRLANTGQEFTSEDVTAVVGLPSGGVAQHRNNAVGALMGGMARRGFIVRTRYAQSTRPVSHAAVLAHWRGAGW